MNNLILSPVLNSFLSFNTLDEKTKIIVQQRQNKPRIKDLPSIELETEVSRMVSKCFLSFGNNTEGKENEISRISTEINSMILKKYPKFTLYEIADVFLEGSLGFIGDNKHFSVSARSISEWFRIYNQNIHEKAKQAEHKIREEMIQQEEEQKKENAINNFRLMIEEAFQNHLNLEPELDIEERAPMFRQLTADGLTDIIRKDPVKFNKVIELAKPIIEKEKLQDIEKQKNDIAKTFYKVKEVDNKDVYWAERTKVIQQAVALNMLFDLMVHDWCEGIYKK